ncbi:MAG: hypothetical protein HY812_04180 [Planctomycetes bacterium]|nr:hypothetical protein [Planctomycetota bacterium]
MRPFVIETARSNRSKCKVCRRAIQKGTLRFGVLIVGPFGPGYLWHHMTCGARRRLDEVEQAYAASAWENGLDVPSIDSLRALVEESAEKKARRKEPPYAEIAPTGRSKCKRCGTLIAEGTWRVVLSRSVEFYGQTRSGPINLHPGCVAAELCAPDCATLASGFAAALGQNSADLEPGRIEEVLRQIGDLPAV